MKRTFALILALIFCLALAAVPAMAEPELVCYFEDVELHLPASWAGKLLMLPTATGATFYQKASYDRYMQDGLEGGGFLFSLGACVNNSYQELPSYIDLGLSQRSAMHYYLQLPTDYPAYMQDDIRAEYDAMQSQVRGIAQGAVLYE